MESSPRSANGRSGGTSGPGTPRIAPTWRRTTSPSPPAAGTAPPPGLRPRHLGTGDPAGRENIGRLVGRQWRDVRLRDPEVYARSGVTPYDGGQPGERGGPVHRDNGRPVRRGYPPDL